MSIDRTLLIRYLRQLGERGEREVVLESMTAAEAVRAVAGGSLAGAGSPEPDAAVGAADAVGPAEARGRSSPAAGGTPAGTEDDGPGAGDADARQGAASGTRVRASAAAGSPDGGWIAGTAPPVEDAADTEAARTLNVLREEALGCTKCRLHEGRRTVVFGEGSPGADVVVVGEAPGREEDKTGRPFVGPAGKLLDLLLLSIGLPRDRVFICNVLKCRPPKNRDPEPDEVECCSPYLHRQLEIISPKVLLAVGKFAAQTLAGSDESIGRLRGRVHRYRGIPLVASYHPAYLLRSPNQVQKTWEDFQLLRQVLDE